PAPTLMPPLDDVHDAHPAWIAVGAEGAPRRHWASPAKSSAWSEVATEPVGCQPRDLLQGTAFFKQMRGPRDHRQFLLAVQSGKRDAVQVQHLFVAFAHDQQRR